MLGYMLRNEELERYVLFGKVPWDIECNMDGICFVLKTIVYLAINKRRRQKHAKTKLITRPLTAYSTNRRVFVHSASTYPIHFLFLLPSLL